MGLELDEYIYGKFSRYFRRLKKTDPVILNRTIFLDDIKPQLTIIARAVTGKAIEIFPAEREGGYKNHCFFLPVSFSELPTKENNKAFYYYRLLYLSIQQRLNLNWFTAPERATELSRQRAQETAEAVLTELFNEYPITEHIHQLAKNHFCKDDSQKNVPDLSWLYGKWMNNDPENNDTNNLQNVNGTTKEKQEVQLQTLLKAKAVEEVKTLEIDKKQQEDYVMTHNFEKVETADEFSGSWRDFDGSDELRDHEDALQELNLKFTVRVDDPTHSIYQADFVENTTISESATADNAGYYLTYDEWDFSKRRYKPDFCKLYPTTCINTDSIYYQKTISRNAATLTGLRKMITSLNNKMQQQERQLQGDEFDTDALTDLFTDVHSRKTPSEYIYTSKRKQEKDLSILLLLDISLSSDGYAANNRVIDVEKEVSILFGEVLNDFRVDFAIDGFYSKTRNYATYLTMKDFDESWNVAKHKIGAVQPEGYTRIGTALRHAGARMDKRSAQNKWVILISDGKPNDYDQYEGKYGINDVKQALRELNQRNINTYALAIEAQAKYYLPQMFGQNHYQILTTPAELLQAIIQLYQKIKYRN